MVALLLPHHAYRMVMLAKPGDGSYLPGTPPDWKSLR
jgi:hypothetical protein